MILSKDIMEAEVNPEVRITTEVEGSNLRIRVSRAATEEDKEGTEDKVDTEDKEDMEDKEDTETREAADKGI